MSNWSMNVANNQMTIGTDDYSGIVVKDGNTYQTFKLTYIYAHSDFLTNVTCYISDGTNETLITPGTELTLSSGIDTSTDTIYYVLKNTSEIDKVIPLFDQQGRPLIMEITYR